MNRRIVIRESDGEQRGPYSVEEVMDLLELGMVHATDPAWNEEQQKWIPLSEAVNSNPQRSHSQVHDAGVSRGLKVGWLCLVLGLLAFRVSPAGFVFFIASFILSTIAMRSKRLNYVNDGIVLSTATFVATEISIHILGS